MRERILKFINNDKQYPILAGIASGLYSIFYYYYANFTQVNSWEQFAFFVGFFLIFPIVLFYLVHTIFVWSKYKTNNICCYNSCST